MTEKEKGRRIRKEMMLMGKECIRHLGMMAVLTAMSMVFFSAPSFAVVIGDNYGGGIVFSVDATGQHGLVAAKADIPVELGWDSAKKSCQDFREGGYQEWFLPSKVELHQLFEQKDGVGGFTEGNYWSSTERKGYAWGQYFGEVLL